MTLPKLLANLGSFQPPSQTYSQGSNTTEGALENLERLISAILGIITVFAGLYFIINFLLAALAWVTSAGDSGKVQSARDRMIQSTIGLVVVVAAYGIVGLIGSIVGLNILNPRDVLKDLVPITD